MPLMTDERLILALERIERALSRIESHDFSAPRPDPALNDLQQRYDRLDERHRRLRARANETVDQLGLLLEAPRAG